MLPPSFNLNFLLDAERMKGDAAGLRPGRGVRGVEGGIVLGVLTDVERDLEEEATEDFEAWAETSAEEDMRFAFFCPERRLTSSPLQFL